MRSALELPKWDTTRPPSPKWGGVKHRLPGHKQDDG